MNTPHRSLRCARCGATPLWVIVAAPDGALEPVCAACASGVGPEPPPQPNAMPLPMPRPLPRVSAERARGSTISTPLALAAVFVASFLPQAAVLASDTFARVPRALRAAIVAFGDDGADGDPRARAQRYDARVARPSTAPLFARAAIPSCAGVVATPLSPPSTLSTTSVSPVPLPPMRRPTAASATIDPRQGLWITRALLAQMPVRSTLREGDFVTHVNGVPVFSRVPPRTCTGGDRYVRFSVVRGGLLGQRFAPCAPRSPRVDVAQPRREVARPAAALLVAHR